MNRRLLFLTKDASEHHGAHKLCPWTSQESNHAATIPDQVVQPVPLPLLVLLPRAQRAKAGAVFHDEIEVQPEEDGHPRLRELVVSPGDESPRQRPDEVQQLVSLVVVAFAERQGPQFEICGGRGEGLEVFDEGSVWDWGLAA